MAPTSPSTNVAKAELISLSDAAATEKTSFTSFQEMLLSTTRAEALKRSEAAKLHLLESNLNALRLGKGKQAAPAPIEPIIEAVLEDDEDDRTLVERLTSPNPATISSFASMIARSIDRSSGEVILCFGQHNLNQRSSSAIFDSADPTISPLTTSATPFAPLDLSSGLATMSIPIDPPTSGNSDFLSPSTVDSILSTLCQIGSEINAAATILHNPYSPITGQIASASSPASNNEESIQLRWTARSLRILIRRIPESSSQLSEVRICVVGNVDSGKSTTLGVLTKGRLDDGRGRARVALFRHQHEILTGRTSSVGMELLGFDPHGVQIEGKPEDTRKANLSWEEISGQAAKIISFIDLAGHEKYLKTTLFGLTSSSPDFVLLLIGGNAGLIGMSKEHLSVALALNVPVVCIVTKIDSTPPLVLEATLKQLSKVLRSPGCRKTPVFVKDAGMSCELAQSFVAEKACPIFLVSNVTGQGLDLLKTFLNIVSPSSDDRYPVGDALEFSISDVFSVPFTGTVASGVVLRGSVKVGDTVLIGPDTLGAFHSTVIKSIQRKRVNVLFAEAGQSVSFALKRIKRSGVRKGMVILAKVEGQVPPKASRRFEGQVLILYHNTLIAPRYQAMLHVGSVRQTVQIEAIVDKPCIRTGDRATVGFRFVKHAEYIRVGERILFREGKTKGLGVITKLLD